MVCSNKWIAILLIGTIIWVNVQCRGHDQGNSLTSLIGKKVEMDSLTAYSDKAAFEKVKGDREDTRLLLLIDPSCPYSRAQTQDLLDNRSALKGTRVVVVSSTFVALDEYVRKYKFDQFGDAVITVDKSDYFGKKFSIEYVPVMIQLGQGDVIRNVYSGITSIDKLVNK